MLTHNSKVPWPTSYDGRKAYRTDKNGLPNSRGKYIRWEIQGANGVEARIAKLVAPKQKIQPIDIVEVEKALEIDPKYDIRLPKAKARIRNRLNRIYGNLGVNYLDAMNITHITKKVDTACWGTGEKENDEFILCNPYFFLQRQKWAQFLLQHEIMHRALYRGRKHLTNHNLRNIVFDVCINRILAATAGGKPNKAWTEFCQWIYNDDSKKTVLALCNAALTNADLDYLRNEVNPIYAQIWEELYSTQSGTIPFTNPRTGRIFNKKVDGLYVNAIALLNPDDLYYRLKKELTDEDEAALESFMGDGNNPFGHSEDEIDMKGRGRVLIREGADAIAPERTARVEVAVRRSLVPKRFRGINWKAFSNAQTQFWDTFVKKPEDIKDPELEEYAKRIKTQKIMDDVSGHISEAFEEDVKNLPYPEFLTEEGMMLSLLGMRPPKWPFLKNKDGLNGKRRVVCFFDTSPSMEYFMPYVLYMCDKFEDTCDIIFAANNDGAPGVNVFSGSVKPLTSDDVRKMRLGEYHAGISTSFDAVVEYAVDKIQTEYVDAIIVFTDGESSLTPENIQMFNACGKNCYRIYFLDDSPFNKNRTVESDLDQLKGESYTLVVPRSDVIVGV